MIVVMTAYATVDSAVEAIKRGAADYLPKPFQPAQIRHVVEQSIQRRNLKRQVTDLESRLQESAPEVDLESDSPKIRAIMEIAARSAVSDVPVLLQGESGTGKTVLARTIHSLSPRSKHPFVVVNCPTLSEELLASELFGHVRGAFTGAVRDQLGRVEAAEGGTLFLDEIGEISPPLQAKLLRFLEEKEFERLGENKTRKANVRTIAATNRRPRGTCPHRPVSRRSALPIERHRLAIATAAGPAGRHPASGAPVSLVFCEIRPAPAARIVPRRRKTRCDSYPWPGNIRELKNAIERAVILWPAQVIGPEAFPAHISARSKSAESPQIGGDFSLEDIERSISRVWSTRSATLEDAAAILGIDASTLWRKSKKYES